MSIKETLRKLGLNDKEISVYLCLLKNGKNTPTQISKITKINRATVYNVAKSLENKGLVGEELGTKGTFFIPLPLQNMNHIIERQIREIKEKEDLIKKAVDELSLFSTKDNYPIPKIRFIDESNLENFLYSNIGHWVESIRKTDNTWWGNQDHTLSENFGKVLDWYWKSDISKNLNNFIFVNDTPIEREVTDKHKGRSEGIIFKKELDVTATILVAGDYLIMIATRQRPFYLFEIHDKTLAHNMRETFRTLWENTYKKKD